MLVHFVSLYCVIHISCTTSNARKCIWNYVVKFEFLTIQTYTCANVCSVLAVLGF